MKELRLVFSIEGGPNGGTGRSAGESPSRTPTLELKNIAWASAEE